MKYSTVLVAAAFAAGASAQVTRADFPACAVRLRHLSRLN